MDTVDNIVPYTYSSFKKLQTHFQTKLSNIGIEVTEDEAARITFLSRRKYDMYDHFPMGETFYVRLLSWLKENFKKSDRQTAFSIVQNLKFIDQYELKELTMYTFENIINGILSEMKTEDEHNWFSYIETRNSYLENELKNSLFIACADDIRFDFFRRYAMRTYIKPFKKDNFIEYYKLNEKSIEKLSTPKRIFLIDQLSASGTTVLRNNKEEWDGKLHRFIGIWDKKIQDIPIYYCPYMISNVSENNLHDRICKWKKDCGITNEIHLLPTSKIRVSPCIADNTGLNIDRNSAVAQLCENNYHSFKEDEHVRLGGGARYGYGHAGLTLIFQSNCPNNSLYLLWHNFNDWYPLFPRVSHHR